ncbi:hypothetical protein [Kaistia terrae]|uniref:Uncharacterized protein n=1 Tax=Kaistia terrae TaxID=537017 RepID=A0ABW0Q0C1_9HYPH|nr:hypothetical protein [Kaistia terrae]MCX5578979.1 hypothetical protein [Kaistia terrae]
MPDASNIARLILKLESDRLSVEGEEIGFNMGTYIGPRNVSAGILDDRLPNCRTVACIAGHCFLLATGATLQEAAEADADDIETTAAEFLGIAGEQASDLFFDLPEQMQLPDVTVDQAIATLRRLRNTGTVQWLPPQP